MKNSHEFKVHRYTDSEYCNYIVRLVRNLELWIHVIHLLNLDLQTWVSPSQFRPCTSELPPKEPNSCVPILSAPAGVNSKSCGAGTAGCTINSDGMLRLFVALFHILLHISFWRYCGSEKLKNKQTIKLNCFRSKCFYLQLNHEATHRVYCRNMPCILIKDLIRFMLSLSRVRKNQVSESKALLGGW